MTCPWDGWEPANLRFCEADVCGWVTQPANTWSNVGFFVAGLLVMRVARGSAFAFGPLAIATGLTSIALHATSTWIGQLLDQGTMFFESALFVVLGVQRLVGLARKHAVVLYLAIVAASWTTLVLAKKSGIAVFAAQILVFASIELRLRSRDRDTRYRDLAIVVVLFALSYVLWWVDKLGVVCDPRNHVFTAHGAWHLLGAASFWFWYRFYAQFEPR